MFALIVIAVVATLFGFLKRRGYKSREKRSHYTRLGQPKRLPAHKVAKRIGDYL